MNKKQFITSLVALIASGFLGGAVSGWLSQDQAQATNKYPRLKVRSLELVDQNGLVRAGLDMRLGDQPRFFISDGYGKELARLAGSRKGAELTFFDYNSNRLCRLAPLLRGEYHLEFYNRNQVEVTSIGVHRGAAELFLNDSNGVNKIGMNVYKGEAPVLAIMGKDGKKRIGLVHNPANESSGLLFYYPGRKEAIALRVKEDQSLEFLMTSESGNKGSLLNVNNEHSLFGLVDVEPGKEAVAGLALDGKSPELKLQDSQKNRIKGFIDKDGKPSVVMDKNGRVVWKAP